MSAPTTPSRLSHARDLSRPGFYVKLVLVMLVNAMGVYGIMACIPLEKWGVLAFLVVTLLVVDYVYFSKRAIPAKYLVPGLDLIALDPKVSGSMIGSEAFESQESMNYVAEQIAKDVGLLNQAACLNARVVYVESGVDAVGVERLERLGALVHAAIQALPSQFSSCSPDFPAQLRADIDGIRHDARYGVIGVEQSEGGVVISRRSEPVPFKDELNGRVVNLVPVNRIEDALQWVTIDTQTIGVYPESLKERIRDRCALQGAQRLTTLGCATYEAEGYPHDGIELFRRMVRWVVIENFEREVVERGASFAHSQP